MCGVTVNRPSMKHRSNLVSLQPPLSARPPLEPPTLLPYYPIKDLSGNSIFVVENHDLFGEFDKISKKNFQQYQYH